MPQEKADTMEPWNRRVTSLDFQKPKVLVTEEHVIRQTQDFLPSSGASNGSLDKNVKQGPGCVEEGSETKLW